MREGFGRLGLARRRCPRSGQTPLSGCPRGRAFPQRWPRLTAGPPSPRPRGARARAARSVIGRRTADRPSPPPRPRGARAPAARSLIGRSAPAGSGWAVLSGARHHGGDARSRVKMAAAEGPAGDAEPWQSWLPNHVVFLRLREGLKSQSPSEAEKPACPSPSAPPPPLTRSLVVGLGGELFLWDGDGGSFLVVRLRGGGAGEEPSLSQYQVGRGARAARGRGATGSPRAPPFRFGAAAS